MKVKCKEQWALIQKLQAQSRTPEQEQVLQEKKHAITLDLSTD